jgi:hypothetical protein
LEVHVASIFKVKKLAKQEASMKQLTSKAVLLAACLVYSSTLKMEVTTDYVVLQLFITTAVKNLKSYLMYDTF